jgi:hypothetical protein
LAIRFFGTNGEYDRIDADCVMKMNVHPIKSEADYDWALKERFYARDAVRRR